jgi:hypothetical protein
MSVDKTHSSHQLFTLDQLQNLKMDLDAATFTFSPGSRTVDVCFL